MDRRQYIGTLALVGTGVLAGCSGSEGVGSSPEESGRVRSPNDAVHNFDVSEGDTLRIEIDNEEGFNTIVTVDSPEELVADAEVQTEDTITHTAESSGVYMVMIIPDGTASYEIYIESD